MLLAWSWKWVSKTKKCDIGEEAYIKDVPTEGEEGLPQWGQGEEGQS